MTIKDKVRLRGKVLWFKRELGYGFIKESHTGVDYFVHFSQIETDAKFKELEAEQVVEFEIAKHNNKLQADRVVVVEE